MGPSEKHARDTHLQPQPPSNEAGNEVWKLSNMAGKSLNLKRNGAF